MIKTLKNNIHRIVLITILLCITIFNYYGEHVALCDGYGWDGCVYYRDIVENGINEYLSDNISYYHTHRMLPFLIIHYFMNLISISLTPTNVLLVSTTINMLLLCFSVYLFFSISRCLRWSKTTEIMAFSGAFFNFHVLKFMGYCPVMTDMPTFTLCWMAVYCFITRHTILLLLTCLIALITFPLLSLIILILTIMPRDKVYKADITATYSSFTHIINTLMRITYMVWLPTAFILYMLFRYKIRGSMSFNDVFVVRHPQSISIAIIGILAYIIFYFVTTRSLKANWQEIIKSLINPARLALITAAVIIFCLLYHLPTAHGFEGPFSLVNELAMICQFPATDILIFLETPFLYIGTIFVLMILLWPRLCSMVMEWGIGYFLILLLALFFLPDIETRKPICFFIFMLLPLMTVINTMTPKMWHAIALSALQIGLSFFWITINVPGTEEAFNTYSVDVYMQWPSQRYYMFQGPWQSFPVYITVSAVEIVIITAIWIYLKKNYKNFI